jgi:transposase
MRSIAEKIGVTPETVRSWVRWAETDAQAASGDYHRDAERIRELARKYRELKRANEILKAAAFFAREFDPVGADKCGMLGRGEGGEGRGAGAGWCRGR